MRLDPEGPPVIAEALALARTLGPAMAQGADEGPRLDRAVDLILREGDGVPDGARVEVARVLWRTGNYEEADRLGSLEQLGRLAALRCEGRGLLDQLAKVQTDQDRRIALANQRLWAERIERQARPLDIAPRSGPPIRIGFLSSDLKSHVVGYFVQPVFEHVPVGTEIYVYANEPPPQNDPAAKWFAGRATGYRVLPGDDADAAALIARDQLDLLIEIGGPTTANRPGVVAFKPARRQASWLGYPQSLGLSAIDYLMSDARFRPEQPDLALEPILAAPSTYICMGPAAFPDHLPLAEPPCLRNGYVTFGTANDPYKYTPRVLAAWADILRRTPGARFMFLRPEAGSAHFQRNIGRHFEAAGVDADRLIFRGVRGNIRPIYGEIDIALDTFPVTGGTTTCDAIWMGLPVVSMVGPAPYERMSWSILGGIGLHEFVARDLDGYVGRAVELAGRPDLLGALRGGMRGRIRGATLGQPLQFAFDFYTSIMNAID